MFGDKRNKPVEEWSILTGEKCSVLTGEKCSDLTGEECLVNGFLTSEECSVDGQMGGRSVNRRSDGPKEYTQDYFFGCRHACRDAGRHAGRIKSLKKWTLLECPLKIKS